jgi:hypothetical protein
LPAGRVAAAGLRLFRFNILLNICFRVSTAAANAVAPEANLVLSGKGGGHIFSWVLTYYDAKKRKSVVVGLVSEFGRWNVERSTNFRDESIHFNL